MTIQGTNATTNQFFRNAPLFANGNPSRSADTLAGTLPALLKIFTFKADYVHPLNDGMKMEAGIKVSSTTNDNDLALYNQNGQGPVFNPLLSNHFIYKEISMPFT
ncbi:MAG: outer membrane beta-barrel protein [Bacteroidota bacterium]